MVTVVDPSEGPIGRYWLLNQTWLEGRQLVEGIDDLVDLEGLRQGSIAIEGVGFA